MGTLPVNIMYISIMGTLDWLTWQWGGDQKSLKGSGRKEHMKKGAVVSVTGVLLQDQILISLHHRPNLEGQWEILCFVLRPVRTVLGGLDSRRLCSGREEHTQGRDRRMTPKSGETDPYWGVFCVHILKSWYLVKIGSSFIF